MKKTVLFLFMISFVLVSIANATIIYVSNYGDGTCLQPNVQAAIDDSTTGDTVIVPSGSCIWSTSVSIPNDKKITLMGAGYDNTVITRPGTAIDMNQSGSRVTGFGFVQSGGSVVIEVQGKGWRIDHCRFNNTTGESKTTIHANGYNITDYPAGLIDQNVFINGRVVVNGLGSFEKMSGIWAGALNLGTDDAVYVEDCIYTRPDQENRNAIDGNRGAKTVFRFNSVTDSYLEAHSLQDDGERAYRKWEVYGNTIHTNSSHMYLPVRLIGGTGITFNNTISGAYSQRVINFYNIRCSYPVGVANRCDGTSIWDGNNALDDATHGSSGVGTATSADTDGEVLTDSSKSWIADTMFAAYYLTAKASGTHDGANNAAILADSGQSWYESNHMRKLLVRNVTDGSSCLIVSNTATTITCTLIGGTDNDWDTGDSYSIVYGSAIYNETDGSSAQVYDNSGTAVTHSLLTGGTDNQWEIGDSYKITYGHPCRDQIGRSTDAYLFDKANPPYPPQESTPAYLWLNRDLGLGGSGSDIADVMVLNHSKNHIRLNRDYYNEVTIFDGTSGVGVGTRSEMDAIVTCTENVGFWVTDEGEWNSNQAGADGRLYQCNDANTWVLYYTPYTYPHPLQGNSIELSGTIISGGVTESEIVTGGETLIGTLTDYTLVATFGADNAITTAFINGLDSAQSEAAGWDAHVKPALNHTHIIRNGNNQFTINFPAAPGYNPSEDENITQTIPATSLVENVEVVATPCFTVTADAAPVPAAALTGTLSDGATKAEIVSGGETLIVTLTDDTWVATIGADNSITTAFIVGLDSAQSEATGWDAVVKANMDYNDVTRTSDTVVTVILGAEITYDITAKETITVTIPTTAVTSSTEIIATPTFDITYESGSCMGKGFSQGGHTLGKGFNAGGSIMGK